MPKNQTVEPLPLQDGETTELLVRFAGGERAAFVEVYRARGLQVRRWVGRFFRSPFEQEEAAQEIWLMVHRMQTSFDVNRGVLGPWLRVVAANRCRELVRAKGRRLESSIPIDDVDEARWLEAPTPADPTLTARVTQAMLAVRATLSADEALVFQQSLLEERPHDEVARNLGVNPRRSKYLKKKLLEHLAADSMLGRLAKELL